MSGDTRRRSGTEDIGESDEYQLQDGDGLPAKPVEAVTPGTADDVFMTDCANAETRGPRCGYEILDLKKRSKIREQDKRARKGGMGLSFRGKVWLACLMFCVVFWYGVGCLLYWLLL